VNRINELFNKELRVVNIGLESFHKDLKGQNVKTVHVKWRPPAGGNQRMASLLSKLKK